MVFHLFEHFKKFYLEEEHQLISLEIFLFNSKQPSVAKFIHRNFPEILIKIICTWKFHLHFLMLIFFVLEYLKTKLKI